MGYNMEKKYMENNKSIMTQSENQLLKSGLIIILFSIALFLSSCAVSNRLSIGDSRYLDVIRMQQLSDNAILAGNGKNNFEDAVKIITFGEHYSLGEKIQGNFICVDYYTYRTVVGTYNTVPVVVKESDYEKYKKGH
jgi:hypothetical protein